MSQAGKNMRNTSAGLVKVNTFLQNYNAQKLLFCCCQYLKRCFKAILPLYLKGFLSLTLNQIITNKNNSF